MAPLIAGNPGRLEDGLLPLKRARQQAAQISFPLFPSGKDAAATIGFVEFRTIAYIGGKFMATPVLRQAL
ncbi:hypothetical protein [Pelagibacterium sediminicola]|uniref:hypothetical protein n=1 Tax=Pelagibacterium sediminicola TaxID=2248761 RepID=UPI0013004CFD|nr:hypothetical protein [Pelagibacterium sediminicola]